MKALNRGLMAIIPALIVAASAQAKPHEHGVVRLDVAVEGQTLTVLIQAPLDSVVGFERAPRTAAERKSAEAALARFRSPLLDAPLIAADSAAQCSLSRAEVSAPVLMPVAQGAPASQVAPAGDHAELEAEYEFTCAQPAALRSLDVGLFEAFRRMQRIEARVVGAQGQAKATLKRPARRLSVVRP